MKSSKRQMSGDTVYKCDTCFKIYSSATSLSGHKQWHKTEMPYKCEVCGKRFHNSGNRNRHLRTHTGEKPYSCQICKRSFSGSDALKKHQQIHIDPGNKFACLFCNKILSTEAGLDAHISRHINEKPDDCKYCELSFVNMSELSSHIARVHKNLRKPQPTDCIFCGKVCFGSSALRSHLHGHTKEKPFPCSVCKRSFGTSASLRIHNLSRHAKLTPKDRESLFKCGLCAEVCKSYSAFQTHKKKHKPKRVYRCEQCPKKYANNNALQEHRNMHNGEFRYNCQVCGKGFHYTSNHRRHVQTHTGERPFRCQVCKKCFSSNATLKSHGKIHVDVGRQFSCLFCGKKLRAQSILKRHLLVHIKEKPIDCTFCEMSFATEARCRSHGKIFHEANFQKPNKTSNIPCIMCEKSFPNATQLKSHLQRHIGEKPHWCPTCDQSFVTTGELTLHIRIKHTKIKPFGCEMCGKKFAWKNVLTQHIQRHLGEKTVKCQICQKGFVTKGDLVKHAWMHNKNLKQNICIFCGKGFHVSNESNFYRHIRQHTREKVHICGTCGQEYACASGLQVHQKIHSGIKPFGCVFCGEEFFTLNRKTNNSLEQHLRNHIGEESFMCDDCPGSFLSWNGLLAHRRKMHK